MRFGVLGPLSVWAADGTLVRVPELKVRALLAALLLHEGRPVSTDRLLDSLWGEDQPGNPANTLQTKVSQLRRALGDRALVAYGPTGYSLASTAVDAVEFGTLFSAALASRDLRTRADLLTDALALWRGPAYADFRDTFAYGSAVRLDEQRLTALEEQAEVRLALGEHQRLADELSELVARHPLRERLRAAHLRALYRAGRQSEALAGYTDLRERLADELGLDPGPDLMALHRAILNQDLGLPPVAVPFTSSLPAQVTSLIGREGEVARLHELLEEERLVTLTGPGGVGKTRLALAAASEAVFPDGVWLVELAGSDGRVAELVAAVLGVRDETSAPPQVPVPEVADRLADALRTRRLLLVLDNCEHLIEEAAAVAATLLRAAPGVRVLATSREPLALPAETVFVVPPLDRAAAFDLFAERAGVPLDAGDVHWAEAVCARLDGLPLALELAAVRVRALGVRGVAERLDDRFRLLGGSSRGRPARQQTLRAVIDWSWEQLTEEQRAGMLALAVHPGGCTLEAAEAVGVDLDLLDQLVNRSMVTGAPRYRLLESVTAYCLERLDADASVFELRDRYYTGLAERAAPHLYSGGQRQWLARLDEEDLNLRAVLDRAAPSRLVQALTWYWYLRGRHQEGYRRTKGTAWGAGFALLSGAGRVEGPVFADARSRWFLAHAHLHFGDVEAASGLLDEALAEFRARGDRWGEAAALASRTKLAMFRGDFALAATSGEQSIDLFGELGDRWGHLQASDMLGYLAEVTGDHARARRLHSEGLRIAEDLGLRTDVSYRLSSLGRVALLTGDLKRSTDLHEQGMRVAAEQANRFAEEFARVGLALVARRSGELDRAETLLRESLNWNRRLETEFGVPFYGVTLILAELGFVAAARGETAVARRLHTRGLNAAREVGDPRSVALALEGLAEVEALEGSPVEAARLLGEAEDLRASVGAPLPPAERGDVDRIRSLIRP
ncbi:BTAD domain-containing putative transcriptional regulator [Amycolatopsis umgeniensis]|uniref:Putative ATPase n=1 Tax=Amycolatopsis umgeniensis TaxID=336628 RepID=A0A841AVC3_9PSEU|nr:BTAD domain-containing putative transcriptional regulator [Amycolatopsis umgeniensis]MBB5850282.1 putative ATPase [Amycolatopsis umgeniensis]